MSCDCCAYDVVLRAVGHAGYAVDEAHQRNTASRRTVERVGFELVDTVAASPEALAIDVAQEVCRYRWELHNPERS